ncbi:hypothetical protein MNV49_003287 [Pseudohyphozyma bogoriensis]|nr:hypothetical protein MNV49_003287 [Pseudohyphozyma bogoriensis]
MDPRFSRLKTDPRFMRPKASKHKLVLDDRFLSLLDPTDKGKGKKSVDKYGRKREQNEDSQELKRFYRVEKDEEEAADEEEEEGSEEDQSGEEEKGGEEDEEEDDEEEDDDDEGQEAKPLDLARGEGLLESSDEEDAAADSDASDSDSDGSVHLAPTHNRLRRDRSRSRSPSIDLSETEHVEADADESDEEEQDPTRRLAIVNMDWDHLRASDLYRVLASPLALTAPAPEPSKQIKKLDDEGNELVGVGKIKIAKGRLKNLIIYQSSFGRERIEREAREGPPADLFYKKDGDSDDEGETMVLGRMKSLTKSSKKKRSKKLQESSDEKEEITEADVLRDQINDGEEEYDTEALRRYQLERLRYYYAIATFDSSASAAHVLTEINGTEFERTANVFDLQYVPNETTFDDDPVHDEATEASIAAEGTNYEGIEFVTDALRHSKVKLTWDADDPHRKNKITSYLAATTDKGKGKGKGREMNEDDIKVYLASSSEDEGEEEEEADEFFEADTDKKSKKKDRLRSLFGLDDAGASERAWDGSGKHKDANSGMEITFAPALSEFGGQEAKSRDQETAIETYKRKEKERRERKKAERKAKKNGEKLPAEGEEGPEFGGKDTGPGGFDDDFFAIDDDAFDRWDRGEDFDDAPSAAGQKKKLNKKERRELKRREEEENKKSRDELALLIDDDDEGEELGEDATKHFDLRKIIKAEKKKGKKVKKGKGKDEPEVQDAFKIDVADDRFKALHEDHEFAIDPSNPKYVKTKSMDALLAEGRKRRAKKHDARAPVGAQERGVKVASKDDEGESLRKLVESVKRKAGDVGGRGKRSKLED